MHSRRGLGRHAAWRIAALPAGALLAALIAVPAAWASTPYVDIHSSGPLSDIYIGNDLGCQVREGGFSGTEFFPDAPGPGDCGTFLFINADGNSGFLGPDFGNHASGTHTTGNLAAAEMPFTPVSQSLIGSGTASSPYRVTTVVSGVDGTLNLTFTEVDTYVVGDNFWSTDVTVANNSALAVFTGELYHAADCQLRGNDDGFGEFPPPTSPNAATCTPNVLGSPASALEQLVPITTGSSWEQRSVPGSPGLWADLNGSALADSCLNCRATIVNNGIGIEWPINGGNGLAAGESETLSFHTVIVDTVPAGGLSFNGAAGTTVGGTVATITDPNTSATPSAYTATINWGDGTSSAGTVTGGNGNFSVTGNHAYISGGHFPVAVTVTSAGTSQGSSTVTDSATITAAPATVLTGAPSVTATGAGFLGSANPNGLPTTAVFQYGLDLKYRTPGASGPNYTNSTSAQNVGSDFASHIVTAAVAGLVPNAVYHVRMVATNSDGTTFGPDVTFTTGKQSAPPPPTLGKTFNVSLVSGLVLVKINGQLIPLTELTQIPKNTLIDALQGTISLTTAVPGPSGARDAAAKGKKHKTKAQKGTFGGAIFKITQATRGAGKGLVTLAIVEGAFKGAPTYSTCKAHKAADATAASSRTLQLLHASAHGKFRTKGHYSSATVLGTKWTVADRCDGTLTHDITDAVVVSDFVRHRTIVLDAGQSYLAKARK